MKRLLFFSFILFITDQAVKLFIAYFHMNSHVVFLPGILLFHPVQNTNLSWIASIAGYKTPVYIMLLLQILGTAIIILTHRYFIYLWQQGAYLLNGMFAFYISGLICSFVDVMFWGGSLDFIRLFDWFTFDSKDVYLTIGSAFLLLYSGLYYIRKYRKLSKAERRQTGIIIWIKNGMPSLPME